MRLADTAYYKSKIENPTYKAITMTPRQDLLLYYLTLMADDTGSSDFNRYSLVRRLSDIYHPDDLIDPLNELEQDLTILVRLGKITWSSVMTKGHCWDVVWIHTEAEH